MTSLTHDTTNDTRHKDLMSTVREYGRDSGAGNDSLPKLALKLVQASSEGVITHSKKGDDQSDAKDIYNAYTEAESKKAIHTANGRKSNISKFNKLIEFGASTNCEPVDVLNDAVVAHQDMRDNDLKTKAAFAGFVDIARTQLKQDSALTDEQIRETLSKPESADPTVEKKLQQVEKILEKLITGEEDLVDQHEDTIKAHTLIVGRLAMLGRADALSALKAQADELGMSISDDEVTEASE